MASDSDESKPKVPSLVREWGTNPLPPTLLSSLIVPLHTRPLKAPVLFVAPLLFASYVNLSGYTTDAAAMSAAWSGLYAVLAMRRSQGWKGRLSVRGAVRGAAVGLGLANLACGAWVWATGSRLADAEEREERQRWG